MIRLSNSPWRLIIFTRYPVPGKTKTRLIPALGPEGAAKLQEIMTGHAVLQGRCVSVMKPATIEVRFEGGTHRDLRKWLGADLHYVSQGEGNLGQRMARAFDDAFRTGADRAVLIGSDCPDITANLLINAFESLDNRDLVIGPATDGGYYLIGLNAPAHFLFDDIAWGRNTVFSRTCEIAGGHGLRVFKLETLSDVDHPKDIHVCDRIFSQYTVSETISVVIPTLNEESVISETVQRILPHVTEVIVADGGSRDKTVSLARQAGARTVNLTYGRGAQMNAAALAARGSILLFLHADTNLPENFSADIIQALRLPCAAAGAFSLGIEGEGIMFRMVEVAANLRSRFLRLPYGDQALFLLRDTFIRLGGFANFPIMEDFELIRRLSWRNRVVTLNRCVTTSARRWRHLGIWRTTLINQLIVAGYWFGLTPARLALFYRNAIHNHSILTQRKRSIHNKR
ncbi:MAG: TIGR04283 family arsenosugar biosynthesis glycosyltransferase [Desulfatirhabdiaceae bacterium]